MYTKEGINVNTFNILFKNMFDSEDDYERYIVAILIEYFTLKESERKKFIKKDLDVDFKKDDDDFFYLKYKEKIYTFDLLSNKLKFKDKSTNPIKKELLTVNRFHKCFKMALFLIYLNSSKILTGIEDIGGKCVQHSVIEIENEDNKKYILDYTKNLYMEKDDYIDLYNFKVLQIINNEEYYNDQKILTKYVPFDVRIYLFFREEIKKDLNKNKHVLGLNLNN